MIRIRFTITLFILLTVIPAYADINDGLLGHWSFDDDSGLTARDSASSNVGTLLNGSAWSTGKVGSGALRFDGADDYVSIPDSTSLSSIEGSNQATIAFWVNKATSTTTMGMLSRWNASKLFSVYSDANFSVRMLWRYGGSGTGGLTLDHAAGASSLMAAGTWHHVVVIYNNPTSQIYINGQLISAKDGSGGSLNTNTTDALFLARYSSLYLNGSLDDVRIYNRALTSDEISQLYALGTGTVPSPIAVNGSCGSAAKTYTSSESFPGGSYCSAGTANPASVSNPLPGGNSSWSCVGSNGGSTSSCLATRSLSGETVPNPPPVSNNPTIYNVKQDGTGHYTTIQACANAAKPGDTCLVYPGAYLEHVFTKAGGTSPSNRITFRANKAEGLVTMQGFRITHPYVTVEGFDITGYTSRYLGHITLMTGGDHCQIINNVIRDGATDIAGIRFYLSGDRTTANNCLIRGNILKNLNYTFLSINGANHTFENNILEHLNNRDYMYVFGHGHVFRRNIFRDGNTVTGIGNHPDWVQTFGDNGGESYDMLFEENWIENLESQLGQIDGGGGSRGIVQTIHDWVFRNNVFIAVSNNMNTGLPGLRFENNTFYRMAHTQNGIGVYSILTRGDSSRNVFKNNAFVAGGHSPHSDKDIRGFYNLSGGVLTTEVLRTFATGGDDTIALAIARDLTAKGYLQNPNGKLMPKAKALTDISQLVLDDAFALGTLEKYKILDLDKTEEQMMLKDLIEKGVVSDISPDTVRVLHNLNQKESIVRGIANNAFDKLWALLQQAPSYKNAIYDLLIRTVQLDQSARQTSMADYNFVSGSGPNYYPKSNSNCSEGVFSPYNFCETNGINGGNPRFINEADPDGPDNIPFTLDDGLKPLPNSPLCLKGEGKIDIGAYSCDPKIVLAIAPKPSGELKGDVSFDGKVSMYDAALVLRYTLGSALSDAQKQKADMNADGKIDGSDVLAIGRKALGL